MEKVILNPYLPSAAQLDELSIKEFSAWISEAQDVLKLRIVQRDPLTHLKKRVTQIIQTDYPEATKEEIVLAEIRSFHGETATVSKTVPIQVTPEDVKEILNPS